jgi:site-specific recombinase
VLAVQWLARWGAGAPLVGEPSRRSTCCTALTLLGPTALFAAFTGVLLFASSLIAGWAENWFVFHRLDSAHAPGTRASWPAGRGARAALGRLVARNISGMAANVSLGMMLGLVPALLAFVGLPLDVRHVTLATGQLAAALACAGLGVLADPASGGAWPAWP